MPPKGWKKNKNVIKEPLKKRGRPKLSKKIKDDSVGLRENRLKQMKTEALINIAATLQELYRQLIAL